MISASLACICEGLRWELATDEELAIVCAPWLDTALPIDSLTFIMIHSLSHVNRQKPALSSAP